MVMISALSSKVGQIWKKYIIIWIRVNSIQYNACVFLIWPILEARAEIKTIIIIFKELRLKKKFKQNFF